MLNQYCFLALNAAPPLADAREMAAQVRAEHVASGRRLDIDVLCHRFGIEVVDAPLESPEGGCEALLVPTADSSFRIVVDTALGGGAQLRRRRRRFRIAHELAHTAFYSKGRGRPRRSMPGGSKIEEMFCDEFARALLVPAQRRGLTAPDVVELHQRFDVSLEVAARSAATAPDSPRLALWWWRASRGRRPALLEQWTTDAAIVGELDVVPYRTDPGSLDRWFREAAERLSGRLSFVVLPARRQALAVVRR